MSDSIIGLIGGTALEAWPELENISREVISTPYGNPSSSLLHAEFSGSKLVFINRHGEHHSIPPHLINYRANLWALQQVGVQRVVAVASVGGIRGGMAPGVMSVPDQIIDYTHGRQQSFYNENFTVDRHIDFTFPYSESTRHWLINAANSAGQVLIDGGVYGVTQGPRLETAAEIRRMARDGCDIVGMTGMPEAALAKELDLDYACCAVVVNWAAGVTEETITIEDIKRVVQNSNDDLLRLLAVAIRSL